MTRTHFIPGCAIVCLAAACGGGTSQGAAAADCSAITAENIDECLRLNHLQVRGTHNTYHVAPEPALQQVLGERARNYDYTHRPLTEQLSQLQIRQFELDVFADPEGGRFAEPAALGRVPGLQAPGPAMRQPGLKVLHVQDIDYRTT